ncbi:MAG: hypothetical protein KGJ98_09160 [Chloroflexota bacterium]|nr:hypothetical protein [Chloroflexota bacterium]
MSALFLVTASFLASSVEMVEASTIVLAVGVSREWRSTLIGVGSALVALAAIVAALGPALALIPIDALRLFIGALLLIFGLQWLRKAILRASGHKAPHDEDAIYKRELADARSAQTELRAGMDWYAFTLSFKGVFLEGLEVIFIVLTFGTTQGSIPLAALGAAAAVLLVGTAAVIVHQPLSRVPENAMKFVVGALLTTFGLFWGGEGLGVAWPGQDAAIPMVLGFVLVVAAGFVAALQRMKVGAAAPALAVRDAGVK